jgi:hypothetical protein
MPFLSSIAPSSRLGNRVRATVLLAASLVLSACSDDVRDIEIARAPAATGRKPAPMGLTSSERIFGFLPWSWESPEGWRPLAPRDRFTLALYALPGDQRGEVSVSFLGGDPKVAENVNRWRSQFADLKPLESDEIRALPRVPAMGREAVIAEIEGTYRGRMGTVEEQNHALVGAILPVEQGALFVRMLAPATVAKAHRATFDRFLASFRERRAGARRAPESGTPRAPTKAEPRVAWTTPEGWTERPATGMRLATFVPAAHEDVECTLFVMSAGGLVENVNLWREQMGAEALSEAEVAALPTVKVLGQDAPLVEVRGSFMGKRGREIEDATLLGLICPLEGRNVFVKMVGPAEVVEAERERFLALVASLRVQT